MLVLEGHGILKFCLIDKFNTADDKWHTFWWTPESVLFVELFNVQIYHEKGKFLKFLKVTAKPIKGLKKL